MGVVAAAGLGVALAAWQQMRGAEEQRILAAFRRRADTQVHLARVRLRLYEEMVHNLHNLFSHSERVGRGEFEGAAARIFERHTGVQALQWLETVPAEELPAFAAAAEKEYPGFRIFERAPEGTTRPPGARAEYHVIRLVAPLAGNERALGYDASTAPSGDVLSRARRERQLSVSQPFRLIQSASPKDENGVVFALPVFAPARDGTAHRIRGFVQGVFRLETMLAQSHRSRPDETVLLHYTDLDAPPALATLYANLAGREVRPADFTPEAMGASPDTTVREVLRVGGRRWQLTALINPAWQSAQRTFTPALALLGGLATTALAVFSLGVLLRRAGVVENQVALRTAELERTKRELENDIARRRAAELALQNSETRLNAILDNSPLVIFVKDLQGRYLLSNPQHTRNLMRPRDQIVGRTDAELFPPETAALFAANDRKVIAGGGPEEFEETALMDGRLMTGIVQKFLLRDADGRPYAICGISTDITERKRAEQERRDLERRLQDKQRLESLGVLAGGVAHDFNNILTAVLGHASLAQLQLPADAPLRSPLAQIEHAARRAADLCSQLLAYAGRGRLTPSRLDLSALVRDIVSLLEISIGKDKHLALDLAPALPPVLADPTKIRQIVMNLVINAAEAIGDRAGEIAIRTATVRATAAELRRGVQQPELPDGNYVSLEIRDNGAGIPAEVMARIFEPFFTTKFSGRGLGLSAVLGIVRSHHGALFVESEPGRGTSFRLLLPAAAGPVDGSPAGRPAAADHAALPRLRGTVLLVDDESAVRELGTLALRHLGLEVIQARDGIEALSLWRERRAEIGLILLDLTMPRLSGEETLRRLRTEGATQKVILLSGYSANESTERCLQLGAAAFLQKPYELAQISRTLAAHLPAQPDGNH
ncbi:MAG: hypothetical protein C0502_04925 [Opitutus sp.]|nr:hypothetical protein [Opitutus sp.]